MTFAGPHLTCGCGKATCRNQARHTHWSIGLQLPFPWLAGDTDLNAGANSTETVLQIEAYSWTIEDLEIFSVHSLVHVGIIG